MLSRIRAVSNAAMESGALVTIETESQLVPYRSHHPRKCTTVNVNFLLRKADLSRKDAASNQVSNVPQQSENLTSASVVKAHHWNPFLPYDKALYVQHVPPEHVLLLNKYNVVENHALIVTEKFEEQSSLLTSRDFEALWSVLHEVDGLAFYNAGHVAGASQRHKHLQVVPTPLLPNSSSRTPFDEIFAIRTEESGLNDPARPWISPHLPFLHAIVSVRDCSDIPAPVAALRTMERYTDILEHLEAQVQHARAQGPIVIDDSTTQTDSQRDGRQPYPYNLLVTRDYMVVVPRRKEFYEGNFEGKVSVNSLGFVGCLLVRNEQQLEHVVAAPMDVLRSTAFACD